ncbi:AraC family transcriptional regulator [Rathayibacter sp. VKM Ac-2760]|uniref:helix-turn-helix transcriptional regulator n=1 Tax=Rathayibacter sp. VKM Ac-2760 TaxID=2609253 RepID=UPI001FCA3BEC|nr:AraC family transcriptional regulator [Rathayibacter sp. VKM Ac-2760]
MESAVLDDVLESLEGTLGATRRAVLAAGGRMVLDADVVALVYVVAGETTVLAPEAPAGALDAGRAMMLAADETGRALDVVAGAASLPRTLLAGDALLTLGRRAATLLSVSGARLTVIELHLDDRACLRVLPGLVVANGFARLEPAAAALAAQLEPTCTASARSGDHTICRLMVRTVLLSVVRAWASGEASGAASSTGDVFLDRVVAAVSSEPGRDWTVDRLAGVAAMSRTVLTERFRAAFGRSPAGFVAEVRMRRAKELLEAGRSVSEVSRELGYSSDDGFSRAFRRQVGVVPSLWRSTRRAS